MKTAATSRAETARPNRSNPPAQADRELAAAQRRIALEAATRDYLIQHESVAECKAELDAAQGQLAVNAARLTSLLPLGAAICLDAPIDEDRAGVEIKPPADQPIADLDDGAIAGILRRRPELRAAITKTAIDRAMLRHALELDPKLDARWPRKPGEPRVVVLTVKAAAKIEASNDAAKRCEETA